MVWSEILTTFAYIMGSFFNVLSNHYIGQYSLLHIFVGVSFLHITLWFIMSLINPFFKGYDPQRSEAIREGVSNYYNDKRISAKLFYKRRTGQVGNYYNQWGGKK